QSDSTLPPNEVIIASERLILIHSEIAIKYADAKHQQTQRLARWAIAAGMVSVTVAIVFRVTQCPAKKPTRENWPAAIEKPTVATPTPTAPPPSPPPSEEAASPSPGASPTASPKASRVVIHSPRAREEKSPGLKVKTSICFVPHIF